MVKQLELDFTSSGELLEHEEELLALLLYYRGRFITPTLIQNRISYFRADSENAHNDGGRLKIRQAIRKLRLDPNVSFMIISSSKGYKIATEKEARKYITNLKVATLKKWKLYWSFETKLAQDGQLKMMYQGELKETIAHIEGIERQMKGGKTNASRNN